MVEQIYNLFKNNLSFIKRDKETVYSIINNKNNKIFEKRENNKLIGVSVINNNTILLIVVDKAHRDKGIGTELLNLSEEYIKSQNYDSVILGVGYDYIMPGVPTSKKYAESVNEELYSELNRKASDFFENKGYIHSWGDCNCFDMKMQLKDFSKLEYNIGDTINGVIYRWANIDDLESIIRCVDDACQFQDESFSKYYDNNALYNENNVQKVLLAVSDKKVVGSLIVTTQSYQESMGSVGCTCVIPEYCHRKIGSNLVMLGTRYLKDIGKEIATLEYTYSGLDKLYGYSGYKISTYYFMGKKTF